MRPVSQVTFDHERQNQDNEPGIDNHISHIHRRRRGRDRWLTAPPNATYVDLRFHQTLARVPVSLLSLFALVKDDIDGDTLGAESSKILL